MTLVGKSSFIFTALGAFSSIPLALSIYTPIFTAHRKKGEIVGNEVLKNNPLQELEKKSREMDPPHSRSHLPGQVVRAKKYSKEQTKSVIEFPKVMKLWVFHDPTNKHKIDGIHTKNLNCCDDKDMNYSRKGLQIQEVQDFDIDYSDGDSCFLFLQFPDKFDKVNEVNELLSKYAAEWVQMYWSPVFSSWPFKWTAIKTRNKGATEINYKFFSASPSTSQYSREFTPKLEFPENNSNIFLIKFPKAKLIQFLDE